MASLSFVARKCTPNVKALQTITKRFVQSVSVFLTVNNAFIFIEVLGVFVLAKIFHLIDNFS